MSCRSFLILQGVASPFFSELERALTQANYSVLKVNFCGGDLLSGRFFSTALNYINFKQKLNTLPSFYEIVFSENNITDIILFGDTRPVHRPAIELAHKQNINIHVYEEGYFRPNWVTLDAGGVNAYSSLSKDPDWFVNYAKHLPAQKISDATGGGLGIRAWHDIRYHIAKTLLKPWFPHYQSHRPDHIIREYWGFIRRIPAVKFYYSKRANQRINALISSQKSFYLLPLQLGADSQMRLHSPFKTVTEMILKTIQSFAAYAPADSALVIKNHPLDPWFVDYSAVISDAVKQNNINESRLVFLEAGNLEELLKHSKGTVLVNSTVGTSALTQNCPVIALGKAIYDIKGLTFQGKLDDFWTHASPPDSVLFNAFQNAVIKQTQINGSFYNQKGIGMAVKESMSRFNTEQTTALNSVTTIGNIS